MVWRVNYKYRRKEDRNVFFRFVAHKHVREIVIDKGKLKCCYREREHGRYSEDMADEQFFDECLPYITREDGKRPAWNVFFARVGKYCNGMTVDQALDYVKEHGDLFCLNYIEKPKMEYGFIVNIKHLDIRKAYGNKKEGTFDFIRVEMILRSMDYKERNRMITENKKEIISYALDWIGKNERYRAYGVSTDFLKPYSMGVNGSVLILDFELKGSA